MRNQVQMGGVNSGKTGKNHYGIENNIRRMKVGLAEGKKKTRAWWMNKMDETYFFVLPLQWKKTGDCMRKSAFLIS